MNGVKGRVVITSKETAPYEKSIVELEAAYNNGAIKIYEVSELSTAIVWMFQRELDAAIFAERAIENGFEYVHREVGLV